MMLPLPVTLKRTKIFVSIAVLQENLQCFYSSLLLHVFTGLLAAIRPCGIIVFLAELSQQNQSHKYMPCFMNSSEKTPVLPTL